MTHPSVIPEDFAAYVMSHNREQTRAKYGIGPKLMAEWIEALGLTERYRHKNAFTMGSNPSTGKPAINRKPIPPDWAKVAPTLTRKAACAHYNAGFLTVQRWYRESGITPAQFVNPPLPAAKRKTWTLHEQPSAYLPAGAEGDAQRFLQKHMACFKASVVKPSAEGYIVGGRKMTAAEMVEMAVRKGHRV